MKTIKDMLAKLPRKVIYLLAAFVLNALAIKFPGLPLPQPDTIADWTMVLIGAHTVTDVVWIIKNHLLDVVKARRDAGAQP